MTQRANSIMFFIATLAIGGSERQLVQLACGLQRTGWRVTVASCYSHGAFAPELTRAGVRVLSLRRRGAWDLSFLWQLQRALREIKPDIMHGYGLVPNIALGIIRPLLSRTRTIWGLRGSSSGTSGTRLVQRLLARLGVTLSRSIDLAICNSEAGRQHYSRAGYPADRLVVVPNGIDVRLFQPDASDRRETRALWGVADEHRLIGYVARLDPDKDHRSFLLAAKVVCREDSRVRFVCVGGGPEKYQRQLVALTRDLGLDDRVIWAGERQDMPNVYNAFDLAISSSVTEGFSNAIGEAMASGLRCVVTDVGDSAALVSEHGHVARPADPQDLAHAVREALAHHAPRDLAARQRVRDLYSVEDLVQRTSTHFYNVLSRNT